MSSLFKPFTVSHSLVGATPATAANWGYFYRAPFPIEVISVSERHATAGTDAGAVTFVVAKGASGTAVASATAIQTSTFNLKGTADTEQTVVPDAGAPRQLSAGDWLGVKLTGTPTSLAGVVLTVTARRRH